MAEHRRVCELHSSNYLLHAMLRKLVIYRSMTLLALDTLTTKGPAGLYRRMKVWIAKRLSQTKHDWE
jgi:hypothetical protein